MTPVAAATSRSAAFRLVRDRFRALGLDTPELDARLLVAHALGLALEALLADPDAPVGAAGAAAIDALAARRSAREPVARILGRQEFYGREFRLNEATLVPRPDTETLIAAVLDRIDRTGLRSAPLRLADLGTGSGAILLTLLAELPGAGGIGTDISARALDAARANADRLGLADRAAFLAADFTAALDGTFDLIVSNPPYIERAAIAALDPEVRRHDPFAALDGGADGLDAYRAILADGPRLLKPGGALFLEIGADQAAAVAALVAAAGLDRCTIHRDLAGRDRVVSAVAATAGALDVS